jgi:hypothetical protein
MNRLFLLLDRAVFDGTERIAFPRIGNLSGTGCVLLIVGVARIGALRKSASSSSYIAAQSC